MRDQTVKLSAHYVSFPDNELWSDEIGKIKNCKYRIIYCRPEVFVGKFRKDSGSLLILSPNISTGWFLGKTVCCNTYTYFGN